MRHVPLLSSYALRPGVCAVFGAILLALLAACGELETQRVAPLGPSAHTAAPSTVTVAGSFQSELGCPGDWQPDCMMTALIHDTTDGVWQAVFTLPAGDYEYKLTLNGNWDENYGAGAVANGPNIPITLANSMAVKFYYDHATHWATSSETAVIATAAGSFQSELGCPGDWQPDCLRSWLQDPDGDGLYTFQTRELPAGSYEAKVAIAEAWDENYGLDGVVNGPNIPFTVAANGALVRFAYDAQTHLLTITAEPAEPEPSFEFSGFFMPVRNPPTINSAKAGQRVGLHFSLGGDAGLDILAAGYPVSQSVHCTTLSLGSPSSTVGTLRYDMASERYTYLWQTERSWAGSCREFVLQLSDGSVHRALFRFK
jgi:hypothetical protein